MRATGPPTVLSAAPCLRWLCACARCTEGDPVCSGGGDGWNAVKASRKYRTPTIGCACTFLYSSCSTGGGGAGTSPASLLVPRDPALIVRCGIGCVYPQRKEEGKGERMCPRQEPTPRINSREELPDRASRTARDHRLRHHRDSHRQGFAMPATSPIENH
jgi:hypothetical protein